jgi:HK97 family phage prohead protease
MISRRDFTATEQSIDGRTLAGYAAVYGQESRQLSEGGRVFTERIAPGAFDSTLSERADVKLYYNHDASMPLARTRSGTLTLRSDRNGLAFTASLPETTLGNDVRALIERGDLSGEMSFGFIVDEDSWSKDRSQRLVKRARLIEVSIVQDAAYPQTSSSLRSVSAAALEAARARLELHFRRMSDHV